MTRLEQAFYVEGDLSANQNACMSQTTTRGIAVSVESRFLPEKSSKSEGQYAFAYDVTIRNQGDETAQLRSRHWIITDARGNEQEVQGEGVVGEQPVLRPGQAFQYTSWCMLHTPSGSMRGSYQMVTTEGHEFDAEIAPFYLGNPQTLN